MIYSVIFDRKNRENDLNKKDGCHFLWQPLTPEILEYVNRAKNEESRADRLWAYTLLYSSLNYFFGITDPKIVRSDGGKPRLLNHNIFFNISHSDGAVLVTISDECDVGCDIQLEPDESKSKALEKRFLHHVLPCPTSLEIRFYLVEEDSIFEVDLSAAKGSDFTDKWVAMESLMKLTGEGFSALSNISDIADISNVDIRKIKIENKRFSLANSIKNG